MSGWVDACTFLDGTRMRYEILAQGGSGAVRTRALIAALDGEVKARLEGDPARAGLVPANYDFAPEDASGELLRVGLRPRRKESMLIEGSMTLSRDSGELLSVEGRLVKPPSFWTRRVHVTRRYSRIAGVRVPVSMESTAKVMVIGESTFQMSYAYLTINGKPAGEPGTAEDPRACAVSAAPAQVARAGEPHQQGIAFHMRHALDDASAEYAATLEIDPPRPPNAAERRLDGTARAARLRDPERALRTARRGRRHAPRATAHRVSPVLGRRYR